MNNYFMYLLYVVASAGIASYFTNIGLTSTKYISSKKPSWFPPPWLFGVMWTIIYLLYSYSWYEASTYSLINVLYFANIILNVAWCFFFFYLGLWDIALYTLIALDIVLVAQIVLFSKYNSLATIALAPYLGWGLFATFLNYTMIRIN
jgi:tryptophan-rich sensory protein